MFSFRYETLVSLLNKLGTQYLGLNAIEFNQRRFLDPNEVKTLVINREWYLNQVKSRFTTLSVRKEAAQLLSCLEFEEIVAFMDSSDFNKAGLKDCLKLGLSHADAKKESSLLKASIKCILNNIVNVTNKMVLKSKVYQKKMVYTF